MTDKKKRDLLPWVLGVLGVLIVAALWVFLQPTPRIKEKICCRADQLIQFDEATGIFSCLDPPEPRTEPRLLQWKLPTGEFPPGWVKRRKTPARIADGHKPIVTPGVKGKQASGTILGGLGGVLGCGSDMSQPGCGAWVIHRVPMDAVTYRNQPPPRARLVLASDGCHFEWEEKP